MSTDPNITALSETIKLRYDVMMVLEDLGIRFQQERNHLGLFLFDKTNYNTHKIIAGYGKEMLLQRVNRYGNFSGAAEYVIRDAFEFQEWLLSYSDVGTEK